MPQSIVTCFPVSETLVQKMRSQLEGRFEVIVSEQEQIAENIFKADIFFGHAKVPVDWPAVVEAGKLNWICLLYTSPSPRDKRQSRMPSSA